MAIYGSADRREKQIEAQRPKGAAGWSYSPSRGWYNPNAVGTARSPQTGSGKFKFPTTLPALSIADQYAANRRRANIYGTYGSGGTQATEASRAQADALRGIAGGYMGAGRAAAGSLADLGGYAAETGMGTSPATMQSAIDMIAAQEAAQRLGLAGQEAQARVAMQQADLNRRMGLLQELGALEEDILQSRTAAAYNELLKLMGGQQ